MSCWRVHWVWISQKETTTAVAMDSPWYLWCISAPSLCFWSESLFSFTAMHDGGVGESQILPAIPGAAGVPRTNKRDYLSCAQMPPKRSGPNCNKKRTVSCQVIFSSGAEPGWTRLQLPTSQLAVQGPEALLQVHSHQDTRPACYHRATRGFSSL